MRDQESNREGLTCRDVIGLITDYLEATLTEEQIAEFEAHLDGCDACQAYRNTYRRTMELTARSEHVEMPVEMRRRLHDFLLRQLLSGKR